MCKMGYKAVQEVFDFEQKQSMKFERCGHFVKRMKSDPHYIDTCFKTVNFTKKSNITKLWSMLTALVAVTDFVFAMGYFQGLSNITSFAMKINEFSK